MRVAPIALRLFLGLAACGGLAASGALAACGGTSSETPWPVEPSGPALGPSGEGEPGADVQNQAEPPPPTPSEKDAGR